MIKTLGVWIPCNFGEMYEGWRAGRGNLSCVLGKIQVLLNLNKLTLDQIILDMHMCLSS